MAESNLYKVLDTITECISGLNKKVDEIENGSGQSTTDIQDDISTISSCISSYVQDRSGNTVCAPTNSELTGLISDIEDTITSIDEMVVNADI